MSVPHSTIPTEPVAIAVVFYLKPGEDTEALGARIDGRIGAQLGGRVLSRQILDRPDLAMLQAMEQSKNVGQWGNSRVDAVRIARRLVRGVPAHEKRQTFALLREDWDPAAPPYVFPKRDLPAPRELAAKFLRLSGAAAEAGEPRSGGWEGRCGVTQQHGDRIVVVIDGADTANLRDVIEREGWQMSVSPFAADAMDVDFVRALQRGAAKRVPILEPGNGGAR